MIPGIDDLKVGDVIKAGKLFPVIDSTDIEWLVVMVKDNRWGFSLSCQGADLGTVEISRSDTGSYTVRQK